MSYPIGRQRPSTIAITSFIRRALRDSRTLCVRTQETRNFTAGCKMITAGQTGSSARSSMPKVRIHRRARNRPNSGGSFKIR